MSERPGPLFRPELRQAIIDGAKHQTRRVMKPQPPQWIEQFRDWPPSFPLRLEEGNSMVFRYGGEDYEPKPPHGLPGDVWYLKEPLRLEGNIAHYLTPEGDNAFGRIAYDRRDDLFCKWKWKRDTLSAMYMPRYAARDFLTIKFVRVERLQDIHGADDMLAEGVTSALPVGYERGRDLRRQWIRLWDSINGKKHPWNSDPWVFVYTFGDYVRDPGRAMPGAEAAK